MYLLSYHQCAYAAISNSVHQVRMRGLRQDIRHVPTQAVVILGFFFSSRRRHTRWTGDWSSDVCSSDLQFRLSCLGCSVDCHVHHRCNGLWPWLVVESPVAFLTMGPALAHFNCAVTIRSSLTSGPNRVTYRKR